MLAMAFQAHGAAACGEPGLCIQVEESEDKLAANLASLGLDLPDRSRRKKLVDHVRSACSAIDRLPMIFFRGAGSLKTSVGMAIIWSPWAN